MHDTKFNCTGYQRKRFR